MARYAIGMSSNGGPSESERTDELQRALTDIENDDFAALRGRLAANPSLAAARLSREDTLLHWACHRKLAGAVQLLLDAGADPNARGFFGKTPMHAAVNDTDARRAAPIVRLPMAHGADLTIGDEGGFTAIDWAHQEVWAPQDEAPTPTTTCSLWRCASARHGFHGRLLGLSLVGVTASSASACAAPKSRGSTTRAARDRSPAFASRASNACAL